MAMVFESAQQLYYIKRFQLSENTTFIDLFRNHAYRWLIWAGLSLLLINYVKNIATKKPATIDFFKYVLVVILIVFVNILSISVIQLIVSGNPFSIDILFNELFPFFIFQKLPMYTLGYILISIILYFYFINKQLLVEVHDLSEIKEINADRYKKLRNTFKDKSQILTIKVGNRRKIIPVNEIYWIEADDYCAKLHLVNNASYSMRISLNSLEKTLGSEFLRVHRKSIVNMSMVKEFDLSQKPCLTLKNSTTISISKSKIKKVKDFLA